jgi:Family of unknown function (DUF5995)
MSVQSIEEIIARMDTILADAIAAKSPIGYFPALYRQVTIEVDKRTKEGGYFENDARMRQMVVTFAGRYIDAYDLWMAKKEPTKSWEAAFKAVIGWNKLPLQHLVVGINAHINLDLGIAAATVAPGDQLPGFKSDFDKINDLLFGLVDTMQGRLEKISPWMGLLDRFFKKQDERFIEWSMSKARDAAWTFANKLAIASDMADERKILFRDFEAAVIARLVTHPGYLANMVIFIIKRWESKDVAKNILILEGKNI